MSVNSSIDDSIISLEVVEKKYRGRFDIYCCLLSLLSKRPAKKTHIMNACNLNSLAAKKILMKLLKADITSVEKKGRETHYSLTDRGMTALLAANVFMKLMESEAHIDCRKKARELMSGYDDVLEGVYLTSIAGLNIPVAFYSSSARHAVIVAEADSDLLTLYYALASLLAESVNGIDSVSIFAVGDLEEKLKILFENNNKINIYEC